MSKIGQVISEQDIPEPQEPENYERQYGMTPEQEREFELWARRIVPSKPVEAF